MSKLYDDVYNKDCSCSNMYYKVGYIAPKFCGADVINSPVKPSCVANIGCSTDGISLCKYPIMSNQSRLFYPRTNPDCCYKYIRYW
ncbi:MAG: hypothetical protein WD512_16310 [Candidatus Paceibacterota bacterium]